MSRRIKAYFIGGLGSNYYFVKDFFEELYMDTVYLNPYKEMIQDKKHYKVGLIMK